MRIDLYYNPIILMRDRAQPPLTVNNTKYRTIQTCFICHSAMKKKYWIIKDRLQTIDAEELKHIMI